MAISTAECASKGIAITTSTFSTLPCAFLRRFFTLIWIIILIIGIIIRSLWLLLVWLLIARFLGIGVLIPTPVWALMLVLVLVTVYGEYPQIHWLISRVVSVWLLSWFYTHCALKALFSLCSGSTSMHKVGWVTHSSENTYLWLETLHEFIKSLLFS